jgi:hypothetical protein
MVDKITLLTLASLQNESTALAQINANSQTIQTAFDNTLSRDGTIPNQMTNNLDMNSNQILNLPAPATSNSPARLVDVTGTAPLINVPPVGTSGSAVPFLNGANTWSGTQTFTDTTIQVAGTTSGATGVKATAIASGTLTLPIGNDTLVARTSTDTLTNKTLTTPVISTISNTGTLTLPTTTDTLVGRVTTDTLTNKTLTAPAISAPAITGGVTITGTTAVTGNETVSGTLTAGAAGFAVDATGNVAAGVIKSGGWVRTTTDYAVPTTNIVLANIPGLSVNIVSGNAYLVSGVLFLPAIASGQNFRVAIGGTAGASTVAANANWTAVNGANLATLLVNAGTLPALVVNLNNANGNASMMLIEGTVVCNSSGTLTLQIAQSASNAIAQTVMAGSNLSVWQVS